MHDRVQPAVRNQARVYIDDQWSRGMDQMSHCILLIQNDSSDAEAVRDALTLETDLQVEWVRACSDGCGRLAAGESWRPCRIAAVLVDLFLADSQGIETFDRLFSAAPRTPVLVLCAAADEHIAKLAVQRGAQDYLLKSRLDGYTLPKALFNMIERVANAEALFDEKERAQITLNSIGDAVMSTDVRGDVTYLNPVAERMTGWSLQEAAGHPIGEVFHIVNAATRETVEDPMAQAIRKNGTVSLTPNCVLLRRDGGASAIEDSTAPIHDRHGQVTGAVMVFHDVTAARAKSLRMAHLAQHDSLTDLPNRILLTDRLNQALALAQRQKHMLALLFLDLDRFKHVNDSFGHAIGDQLLKTVARILVGCVRASDTVSRQGGDEFVILVAHVTDAKGAAVIAEKILGALRGSHRIEQHDLHVSVSIGVVTYPADGAVAETLLKKADFAMYQAKDCGRDNYQFFLPEANLRALERQALANDLRRALWRHEFELFYQPKMNLETGEIIGVEALIRWHHPQRGLVPPAQFIPIAEEFGFIVAIGNWVLQEACAQARAWQKLGLPLIQIAVNVSAVELRAKDFVSGVRSILRDAGLHPSCLELELTETFLMQDSTSTAVVLQELKDMGVQLALDDFGTGYSSLSYLKRFPISTLKIDQSFVRDLTTDEDDASIVCAVISMGKSLHMRVVAEGVETCEQLAFLREQICPEGQGYYFSQPLTADAFAQLQGSSLAVGMSTASLGLA